MTITRHLIPAACVAIFALTAPPAYAQHRGGGGHGGGTAVARGGGARGGAVSRGGSGGPGIASRGGSRARSSPVYRGGGIRGGVVFARGASRIVGSRGIIVGRSGFYRPYRSFYRPYYSFYRPYYSFRPRLSLAFGLWVGYPVPYPYYYGYAYPYPVDPYAYGYAAPSYGYPAQPYPANPPGTIYPESGSSYSAQPAPSVGVQPRYESGDQQTAPGGVSFQITPDTAAVFVDGTYVGTAGTFGPRSQPLGLIPGRHHIEIRADGYQTMTFDADVTSGQVIPYQGTLQRN